jgi:hypothetical protein
LNKKGVYSITTNFMLIVVLVAAFLFLVSFGVESFSRQKKFSDSIQYLKDSIALKEQILACTGSLTVENLNSLNGKECINADIKGFKIESLEFFGCQKKEWAFGENDSCKKKVVFYLNIMEEKTCLGRLVLCY